MSFLHLDNIKKAYLLGNKEASLGKQLIDKAIFQNDASGLVKLLQFHEEGTISDADTFRRDYVDFFIRYFSVVSLSYLIGYITFEEIKTIKNDVIIYLGNLAIKRFYYKNYPVILPQILYETVLTNKALYRIKPNRQADRLFHEFHTVNQTFENDDVYQFLWFLDGGSTGEYDITDLSEVLKDPKTYIRILKQKRENPLKKSLRGFFDFLFFLDKFNSFLKGIKGDLLRSAVWHFYGYWFEKMKDELGVTVNSFFVGLRSMSAEAADSDRSHLRVLAELSREEEKLKRIVEDVIKKPKYRSQLEQKFDNWRREYQGEYELLIKGNGGKV